MCVHAYNKHVEYMCMYCSMYLFMCLNVCVRVCTSYNNIIRNNIIVMHIMLWQKVLS